MPDRRTHEEFDRYLVDRGVLLPNTKYGEVHKFMDAGVKDFGGEHREVDYYHDVDGLRDWLNGKYNVIQNLATYWLRAGLGHICLDEKESSLSDEYSLDEVFDSAFRSMAQRGWTKSFFKPRR